MNELEFLEFLGQIGATEKDVLDAIEYCNQFNDIETFKKYTLNLLNQYGIIDDIDFIELSELDDLEFFGFVKKAVQSIGRAISRGAEFVKKGITHNIRQIGNFAKSPVGKAIIGAGLVSLAIATGGALAPVALKVGATALKGVEVIAKGIGTVAKAGWGLVKGVGKLAYKGLQKAYQFGKSVVQKIFKPKSIPKEAIKQGIESAVQKAPEQPTSEQVIPEQPQAPYVYQQPQIPYIYQQPQAIDPTLFMMLLLPLLVI